MTNDEKLNLLLTEKKAIETGRLSVLKTEIKALKKTIATDLEDSAYKDFDSTMRSYYTFKFPSKVGGDLTALYNFWNNRKDENNMRELFGDCMENRFMEYDVAEVLFGMGSADAWLEANNVSQDTISKLRAWYYEDNPKLQSIEDLPKKEKKAVLEFIRLFHNIIVSSCILDW